MSNTDVVRNPELVIGLVGPIGVDLDAIISYLEKALQHVGYTTQQIHLTSVLEDFLPNLSIKSESYSSRYQSLIRNADEVRREVNHNGAFAALAISEIRRLRQATQPDLSPKDARDRPLNGTAYIIRQFKREEEISLLRQVYGRKFIQVSIYADKDTRKRQLVKKIKDFGTDIVEDDVAERQALELISIDNNEASDAFGQRVSDVFHLGDVFVLGNASQRADDTVTRFVEAFFGHNGFSPTKNEYGMYAAAGAALRSLDLSRQVGAAIFSGEGEVLALGCNEVPKAFGGTYWADDPGEKHRDFEEGADRNHRTKLRVVHDLVQRMGNLGYLSDALVSKGSVADRVRQLLSEKEIAASRIMDLIEFGRIIHAEMSAITDAARIGRPLKNGTLFCTTFPCHMCAKHIVAAGIRRVVFLEPYPKSHAKDLHDDAITFASGDATEKVLFEPFIGISPRRYRDIFEKKKRKNSDGSAQLWYEGEPVPRIEDRGPAYTENEEPAISLIVNKLFDLAARGMVGEESKPRTE